MKVNNKVMEKLLLDIASTDIDVRLSALDKLSSVLRKRKGKASRILNRITDDYGNRFSYETAVKMIRYHCRRIRCECTTDKDQKKLIREILRRINPDNIEKEKADKRAVCFSLIDIAAVMVVSALAIVCVSNLVSDSRLYRYYKATKLEQDREYDMAADAYEELADYRDSDVRAWAIHDKLGGRYLGEGDYQKALVEYAQAGSEAVDKYNYVLGMLCVQNSDYLEAHRILNKVQNLDMENTMERITILAAVECLEKGNTRECESLLSELPEGYASGSLDADVIHDFVAGNRKWIEAVRKWNVTSGKAGAYKYLSGECPGWEFDATKLPTDANISFALNIDDDMNISVTVTATYPHCIAYADDLSVQSMFVADRTVEKTYSGDELLQATMPLDEYTQLTVGYGSCILKYRLEEMQIMPDDAEGDRALTVKESEILFE